MCSTLPGGESSTLQSSGTRKWAVEVERGCLSILPPSYMCSYLIPLLSVVLPCPQLLGILPIQRPSVLSFPDFSGSDGEGTGAVVRSIAPQSGVGEDV